MSVRLEEKTVVDILNHGCQVIIGRLSVTPVRRAKTLPTEYMVDCEHSKAIGSFHFKNIEDAAAKFCMLKNVIYAN